MTSARNLPDSYAQVLNDPRKPQTLGSNLPQHIDMLLLDGAKALYCDILKLAETGLRTGALVIADDAADSPEYLAYVRDPANGYMTLDFDGDVDLAVRLG